MAICSRCQMNNVVYSYGIRNCLSCGFEPDFQRDIPERKIRKRRTKREMLMAFNQMKNN